jgi:hypothetical protein
MKKKECLVNLNIDIWIIIKSPVKEWDASSGLDLWG